MSIDSKLYPLTFVPIFKERVWGGRNLERLFGKKLPAEKIIGESWEISDRQDDNSIVDRGDLRGVSLQRLLVERQEEIMGASKLLAGRFPLLVKILDAQQKLSLQVHPPASIAGVLGGDPKTEMWLMADCQPNADLFVGLKKGVSREHFENSIDSGDVAECFHRIEVSQGDAMFLPSGRVHAIGAGNVIFEIQQNSDTTYRVYDWGRLGLDGRPRDLHIAESLRSIDFADFEPALVPADMVEAGAGIHRRALVESSLFTVDHLKLSEGAALRPERSDAVQVLGLVSGELVCRGNGIDVSLSAGQFCLLPAAVDALVFTETIASECLLATAG